jgi:AraC-like DNA-binding protein
MYHLLNQFHYLYYEQQELRDDLVELRRFHRIFTYLDVNFKEGASLQELAQQEYLSPSYLSYKIKDTLGLNFHDYLGALRSEAGAKLLLESDKSISEIALDVGFSHPRYFIKRFEEVYDITPQEFRECHAKRQEEYEKLLPSKREILMELSDEARYSSRKKPRTLSVDLKKEPKGAFERCQSLFLGEAVYYLENETQELLKRAQREIGFKHGILEKLFCQDMDIYRGSTRRFYNWTRVEKVLELLMDVHLIPLIYCHGIESYVLEDFVETFSPLYPDVGSWLVHEPERKLLFSSQQDQISQACWVIKNRMDIPILADQITREIPLENDTFFGGEGLFTANFLAKPSYYARKFLGLMGDELLEEGPGYLITKSEEGYQILFYREGPSEQSPSCLNLYGMEEAMGLSRFLLSSRYGSIYDAWRDLGSPERLENEYWYLLNDYVHPILEFDYVQREIVFSLRSKNDLPGITLYLFKKD